MIWCANRALPHFVVRDYEHGVVLDVTTDRWPGTIRFLGDDTLPPPLIQALWCPVADRERAMP